MNFNHEKEIFLTMVDKSNIDLFKKFMPVLFNLSSEPISEGIVGLQGDGEESLEEDKSKNKEQNMSIEYHFNTLRGNSIRDNTYIHFSDGKGAKKLKDVINTYAKIDTNETPLFLFDNTAFGSEKDGILITDKNFYGKSQLS